MNKLFPIFMMALPGALAGIAWMLFSEVITNRRAAHEPRRGTMEIRGLGIVTLASVERTSNSSAASRWPESAAPTALWTKPLDLMHAEYLQRESACGNRNW